MSFAIALTDEQWELVADLFDPPGRRGAPALHLGRQLNEHPDRNLRPVPRLTGSGSS